VTAEIETVYYLSEYINCVENGFYGHAYGQ
jgi:hypothetical protein